MLSPNEVNHGLLLVGHGTRDTAGCEEFLRTAASVADRLGSVANRMGHVAVEPCFLELAEPTIDEAIERLADRNVDCLSVMPLLLFAAGHAKDDIPQAVRAAVNASGFARRLTTSADVISQLPHLGCHPKLLELSALRFHEAIADQPLASSAQTTLVMVGRGSRDKQATTEMRQFSKLRHDGAQVKQTEVCFVAMAEPLIQPYLDQLAQSDAQRIVVQPHLLFGGQLLAKIADLVGEMAQQHPDQEWIVTRHLGPHALLEDAMVDIVTNELPTG